MPPRSWDTASGRLVSVLTGHAGAVNAVALSSRWDRAATGSADFTARIWQASTGKELFLLRHQDQVINMDLSRDGNRLVTTSRDKTARVWDVATGKLLAGFKGHAAPLRHAAFSPDGERVVTASADGTARVWSVRTSQPLEVLPMSLNSATLAVLAPSGEIAAVVSGLPASENSVNLHKCGLEVRPAIALPHEGRVSSIAFSLDDRFVVTTTSETIARLWSANSGELLCALKGHSSPVLGARFSADGNKVVTCSKNGGARVWAVSTGAELFRVNAPMTVTITASFSPDGQRILCGTNHGRVLVADAETGAVILSWMDEELRGLKSAEWSPDSSRVVTTGWTTGTRIWSAITGRSEGVLAHSVQSSFAAYSPDSKWIATVDEDAAVSLWNAKTCEEMLSLKREGFSPGSISFLANRAAICVFHRQTARSESTASALLIYPLEPLTAARKLRSDRLTPGERGQFKIENPLGLPR